MSILWKNRNLFEKIIIKLGRHIPTYNHILNREKLEMQCKIKFMVYNKMK